MNTASNMLYIPWIVNLSDHDIKKKVSKTSIFELSKVKNCMSRLCTIHRPIYSCKPLLVETVISHLLARVLSGPWQGDKLQKKRPFVS